MPAIARAATAPPPIISQRLRRARASLSSASASQFGVDPPGPSNGPPCPKLMPGILMGGSGAAGGGAGADPGRFRGPGGGGGARVSGARFDPYGGGSVSCEFVMRMGLLYLT
ncbi:hypothetical protein ADL22_19315 [Streptomyces sp. NRRL F-4489]|nr:hypothetical protein ADL22_19315 [Streptomyces sp. NRRL F-4489]